MTRQSKNYSHIWDNVMGGPSTNHHRPNCSDRDTTGSTVSTVEYTREEILVSANDCHAKKSAPRVPRHYPPYPPKVFLAEKEKEKPAVKSKQDRPKPIKEAYVSSLDRECAPQPQPLTPWVYKREKKPKYDKTAASLAFEEYSRRLAAKKLKLKEHLEAGKVGAKKDPMPAPPKAAAPKKRRVVINEAATQIVKEDEALPTRCQKLNICTRRNDEIKIDTYCKTKMTATTTTVVEAEGVVDDEDDDNEDDVDVKIQKLKKPGFYGTIEAEKCAEKVAGHISAATEHLERLKFVAEEVMPESGLHLKTLLQINDEIKDFNSQMRTHRAKVPKSTNLTQAAHFVITENRAN